jgi:hypothetical protein
MGIRRSVDPVGSMRRADIIRRNLPDPRGVWKETRSRVKWVAGSIRGDIYPHSQMNSLADI